MLHLRPTNPRRPVDWRWQRAKGRAELGGRVSRRWDDEHMPRVFRFARKLQQAQNDRALERLCIADPALFEAYMLYSDSSPDNMVRAELEARLLTPQPYSDIAERLNLSAEMVDVYEKYFFNVKPHLRSPGYIAHVVIGRELQYGLSERRTDLLLKIYAVAYGPTLLDWVAARCDYGNYLGKDAPITSVLEDDRDRMLVLKSNIAARTMPVTWETQEYIMNLAFKLRELQMNAGATDAQAGLLTALETVLQELPWFVGRGPDSQTQPPELAAADESPISLRAEELYNIDSSGAEVVKLLESPPEFPTTSDAAGSDGQTENH